MSQETESQFFEVIDHLIDTYSTLRNKLKEKRSALQDRDIDRLETLTQEEMDLSGQIEELNRKRHELSLEISSDNRPDDRQKSLEEVKEYLSESEAKKLEERRKKLKNIIRDVQRINEENVVLLENRLKVFDRVFNVIEGESEGDTYDRELDQDESGQSSGPVFINEAV